MSIFYEKRNPELLCFCRVNYLIFVCARNYFCAYTKKDIIQKKIFVSHDQSITAALLENGVSEKIIAESLTNTTKSPQSYELLNKLGITEKTDSRFLPLFQTFRSNQKHLYF